MADTATAADSGGTVLDPLGDAEHEAAAGTKKNYAKVGSGRPSSLLYTYGPGAIMDLPQFTIMPSGLDDWERVWLRRDGVPEIHAPRLLPVVRLMLGQQVAQLRPFPWQAKKSMWSKEGSDLGVPARVFPQWLRCTGCDMLGPLTKFNYSNTHPFRPDQASFEHTQCWGRQGAGPRRKRSRPAVTARYLLACANGHLDEFPYDLWVHRGQPCPAADVPALRMVDRANGKGASATIHCDSCNVRRAMNEAQGEAGRDKLPYCRGRHPHLDQFDPDGCKLEARLMLVGASNLWFVAYQSIIVMPQSKAEAADDLADQLRTKFGRERIMEDRDDLRVLRAGARDKIDGIATRTDAELEAAIEKALTPAVSEDERREQLSNWDPVDLLVPEWRYLQKDPLGHRHEDPSGLMLSARQRGLSLPDSVSRVLAVDKLRKVNAVVGFTRVDEMERVNDLGSRLVPLTRSGKPTWTVATEDRGEGIFLQLDEAAVARWETRTAKSNLWAAHTEAHRRNFERRFSETAANVSHEERFKPPRYWLLHTFAHILIREMAMQCGYSAASLSERIYAWPGAEGREPAAGLLICTTSSDSDGTLGGLVALSEPDRLAGVVNTALMRAQRCSSDPVCATRTPRDPEDFLHGAACHCCAMASETSCERANRFLDRRFILSLPGSSLGFFD
jgi:hypothetical protein